MFTTLFVGLVLIVKYTTSSDGQCVESIGGGCPPGWGLWRGKCYIVTEPLTWIESKQKCIQMGGVMAVPQSREEIDHLSSMQDVYWVGCTDLQTEGSWVCEEGVELIAMWYGSGPSGGQEENCIEIYGSPGYMNDKPCSTPIRTICKRDITPWLHF